MRDPLFILSPPRSFSSLISSMLGQHPELHAFPELQIFSADTLHDMMKTNQERHNRLASPGSIRSIAEIHERLQTDESCTRAWLWMQKRSHWTAVEFFDYLRKKVSTQIAIDKTPINTSKQSRLEKIIHAYPNAKFLHLCRSVNGNTTSLREFIKGQDKLLGRMETNKLTRRALSREFPASVWYLCHRNILAIKPLIKQSNYLQLKGEDLLNQPNKMLSQFCKWINIEDKEEHIQAMLRPHESPYAFVGPSIAVGGNDGKFMKNPILNLKKISSIRSSKTFQENVEMDIIELDCKKFFGNYKQLTDSDLQQINRWSAQITKEITSMQEHLGY